MKISPACRAEEQRSEAGAGRAEAVGDKWSE